MAKQKLIGNDGALYLVKDTSAELVGDVTQTLDELVDGDKASGDGAGFYRITALATALTTVFDFEGAKVGFYFYNDGTLVPAVGDKVKEMVLEVSAVPDASIKSFEIALTKDKIEMTTLPDDIKTYRMGRTDASGTLSGITRADNLDYLNAFLPLLSVAADGEITYSESTDGELILLGFLNEKDVTGGKRIAVIGKIAIENGNIKIVDNTAQEFSSNFSPVSGDRLQLIEILL